MVTAPASRRSPPQLATGGRRSRASASRARRGQHGLHLRGRRPCFTTDAGKPRAPPRRRRDDPDRRHGHLGLHRQRQHAQRADARRRRPTRAGRSPFDRRARYSRTFAHGRRLRVRLRGARADGGHVTVEGEPVETADADADADAHADPRRRRPRPPRRRRRRRPRRLTITRHARARARARRTPRRRGCERERQGPRAAPRALLALGAGDGRDHARAREEHGRAGDRAGARRHARPDPAHQALKKGTYTVELRAADAMGNRAAGRHKSLS